MKNRAAAISAFAAAFLIPISKKINNMKQVEGIKALKHC